MNDWMNTCISTAGLVQELELQFVQNERHSLGCLVARAAAQPPSRHGTPPAVMLAVHDEMAHLSLLQSTWLASSRIGGR